MGSESRVDARNALGPRHHTQHAQSLVHEARATTLVRRHRAPLSARYRIRWVDRSRSLAACLNRPANFGMTPLEPNTVLKYPPLVREMHDALRALHFPGLPEQKGRT